MGGGESRMDSRLRGGVAILLPTNYVFQKWERCTASGVGKPSQVVSGISCRALEQWWEIGN